MTEDTLSKMNREIGETLVMVGSIKDMLDDHKDVHVDIKNLLEKQDERIRILENFKIKVAAYVTVISGIVGYVASALAKVFGG